MHLYLARVSNNLQLSFTTHECYQIRGVGVLRTVYLTNLKAKRSSLDELLETLKS
jgi:hypothetical protein